MAKSATQIVARGNRRRNLRKRRRRRRKKKSLKKRVARLEKYGAQLAVKTVKKRNFTQVECAENEAGYQELGVWRPTVYEEYMNDLKYYNLSAVQAQDVTDPGFYGGVLFDNRFFRVTARNNGQLPLKLKVYWFIAKKDVSSNILTHLTAGDEALGVSTTGNTNGLVHPSDFPNIMSDFTLLRTDSVMLNGGDEIISRYAPKGKVNYDPERHDVDGSPAYPKGSINVLLRAEGVVSHGATTKSTLGTTDGTVDIMYETYFNIRYPSQYKFKYMETDGTYNTQVGGAEVVGPNVDNLADTI